MAASLQQTRRRVSAVRRDTSFMLVCVALLRHSLSAAEPVQAGDFIRISNGLFVDSSCREYVPMGWNWWPWPVMPWAMAAANENSAADAQRVRGAFQRAVAAGFNTFRLFAHGVDNWLTLQTAPGVYNEEVFRGIDFIIAAAGEAGVRVVISPANIWQHDDGLGAFVEWAGEDSARDFYAAPGPRQLFKAHLIAMANRTNHVTNIKYKDDPAIFAWNLMNEARCDANSEAAACVYSMTVWVNAMSQVLKYYAPNHLVSTGFESFFASGSGSEGASPYGSTGSGSLLPIAQGWATTTGQDAFSHLQYVDYLTSHMWPYPNWATPDFNWATAFLSSQMVVASRARKPLVLEEFGIVAETVDEIASVRDVWYRFWTNALTQSRELGGPLRGLLFWWWLPYEPAETTPQDSLGLNVIQGDSTWQIMSQTARNVLMNASQVPVAGCNVVTFLAGR